MGVTLSLFWLKRAAEIIVNIQAVNRAERRLAIDSTAGFHLIGEWKLPN